MVECETDVQRMAGGLPYRRPAARISRRRRSHGENRKDRPSSTHRSARWSTSTTGTDHRCCSCTEARRLRPGRGDDRVPRGARLPHGLDLPARLSRHPHRPSREPDQQADLELAPGHARHRHLRRHVLVGRRPLVVSAGGEGPDHVSALVTLAAVSMRYEFANGINSIEYSLLTAPATGS